MTALFGFCLANEDTLDAASEITSPTADFAAIVSQAINNELVLASNPEARRELDRLAVAVGPGALEIAARAGEGG